MENNITYDETDTIVCGEAQEYFNSLGAEITETQFKLRQDSLRLLMGRFGQANPAKSIYECAHEWSCKYNTTSGLVNYYNTYYNGKHDNT